MAPFTGINDPAESRASESNFASVSEYMVESHTL